MPPLIFLLSIVLGGCSAATAEEGGFRCGPGSALDLALSKLPVDPLSNKEFTAYIRRVDSEWVVSVTLPSDNTYSEYAFYIDDDCNVVNDTIDH